MYSAALRPIIRLMFAGLACRAGWLYLGVMLAPRLAILADFARLPVSVTRVGRRNVRKIF